MLYLSEQTETSAPVTRAGTAECAGISSTITGVSVGTSTQASTATEVSEHNSRDAVLLCTVGNLEMVGRVSFFAESYRLCVRELKSVGWQCAILGQLVGTTKIQDGCRDPGKLQ